MPGSILLLVFLFLIPALVLRMEKSVRLIRCISPIIICYLAGILAGNIPGLSLNHQLLQTVTGLTVFLAIPLLLFSSDFQRMLRQVKPALLAFTLGITAVVIMSVICFFIFRNELPDSGSVSGMMIGVYTGGTPNMSAIGLALGVQEEVFIILNSADIIFSGIYFIFLLSFGKRLLGYFLRKTKYRWENNNTENQVSMQGTRHLRFLYIPAVLLVSVIVLLIAILVSMLIIRNWTMERAVPAIILVITSIGIAASFSRKMRNLPYSYSIANYLLLVFAVSMGSMANLNELLAASSVLFLYCGLMVFGSVLIQYLFAFLFRIDRDIAIIASTASIFGPAFIGPVANALQNKDIIGVGIALGLLGFAVGNYLGIGVSYILN